VICVHPPADNEGEGAREGDARASEMIAAGGAKATKRAGARCKEGFKPVIACPRHRLYQSQSIHV